MLTVARARREPALAPRHRAAAAPHTAPSAARSPPNDDDDDGWADEDDDGDASTAPPSFLADDFLDADPAPGPPAALLAGFRDGEPAAARAALDAAGFGRVAVVPASHALLLQPVRDAVHAPEPDWGAPRAPDAPRGGGWGARRAVLFAGLSPTEQATILAVLESSGLPRLAAVEADEASWLTERAGDALAEALKDADADEAAAASAADASAATATIDCAPMVDDEAALPDAMELVAAAARARAAAGSAGAAVPTAWRDEATSGGAGLLDSIRDNVVEEKEEGSDDEGGGEGSDGDSDDPPSVSLLDAVAAGAVVPAGDDDLGAYLGAAAAATERAAEGKRDDDGEPVAADPPSSSPPPRPPPITIAPVGLDPGEEALHDELMADLEAKFRALPPADRAGLKERMREEARSPTRDAIAAALACGLSPEEVKGMVDDAAAVAADGAGATVPWSDIARISLDPTPEEEDAAAAAAKAGEGEG